MFKVIVTATNFAGQSYTLDNIDVFANPVMGNYTITGGKTASYFMNIPPGVRYVKGSGNLTFNGGFQAGQYRVFSSYTKGADVIFGITPFIVPDIWFDGVSTTATETVSNATITTLNSTTMNATTGNVTTANITTDVVTNGSVSGTWDVAGTSKADTIAPHTGGGAITIASASVKSGYWANVLGANVASAGTITPTGQVFHITGALAIATINLPYAGFNGEIYTIPDGAFTWGMSGNIAVTGIAIVNQCITWTYDSNIGKWYPSYIQSTTQGMNLVSTLNPVNQSSYLCSWTLSPGTRYKLYLNLIQNTTAGALYIQFNGDTGSNYRYNISGNNDGSAYSSNNGAGQTAIFPSESLILAIPTSSMLCEINFVTFYGTNTSVSVEGIYKLTEAGPSLAGFTFWGDYTGGSPLSSITIGTNAGTFSGYATLYILN
jgi:hypothetical protein